jgi:hypothetical protein
MRRNYTRCPRVTSPHGDHVTSPDGALAEQCVGFIRDEDQVSHLNAFLSDVCRAENWNAFFYVILGRLDNNADDNLSANVLAGFNPPLPRNPTEVRILELFGVDDGVAELAVFVEAAGEEVVSKAIWGCSIRAAAPALPRAPAVRQSTRLSLRCSACSDPAAASWLASIILSALCKPRYSKGCWEVTANVGSPAF